MSVVKPHFILYEWLETVALLCYAIRSQLNKLKSISTCLQVFLDINNALTLRFDKSIVAMTLKRVEILSMGQMDVFSFSFCSSGRGNVS